MYPAAADLHLAKVPGHSGASQLRRARAGWVNNAWSYCSRPFIHRRWGPYVR
jgi:hypothetical protein